MAVGHGFSYSIVPLVIYAFLYLVEGGDHRAILFPGEAARHEKVSPKTWRISALADATWYGIWFLRHSQL